MFKKLSLILLVLAIICPIGFASTGDSNFTNVVASGNVTFQSSLIANGRKGGASTMSSSSTYLSAAGIAYSLIEKRVGGGGGLDSDGLGSRLPAGTPGQELTLVITALQSGGSWVITPAHGVKYRGWTKLTMDTVGDTALLLYVDDTVGWIIKSQTGCTVAQNQLA